MRRFQLEGIKQRQEYRLQAVIIVHVQVKRLKGCVDGGRMAAGREAGGIFTRDGRSTQREKEAHLPVILQTQVSISAEIALASLFHLPILTQLDVRDSELQSLPVCVRCSASPRCAPPPSPHKI